MHMTSLSHFLKTSIYLLLMTEYQHIKFGLIWIKESKVTEWGGGGGKVENVLNRPSEIGLNSTKSCLAASFSRGKEILK